jgi:membrane-bound lytic murein transglycosylase MltF
MPLTRRGERLATASTIVFGMMIGYFLPEDPFHQTPDQVSANVYTYLDKLWTQESQWNPYAQNPNSTAYGIAQFLDQTWKQTGINKTDDAKKQIDAGLIYIEQRYKESPCLAWEHSQRKGYY